MKLLFTLPVLLFTLSAAAQINKGQFLVGGSGTYSATSYKEAEMKARGLEIDGRGGIFLLNKLAAGIRVGYRYDKDFYSRQTYRSLSVGPFVRYYFLNASNKVNLLADASYFSSSFKTHNASGATKWKGHGYAFAAGPALFLNPNISLEATLNYENSREALTTRAIRVKVGFQIHLSKNKTRQK